MFNKNCDVSSVALAKALAVTVVALYRVTIYLSFPSFSLFHKRLFCPQRTGLDYTKLNFLIHFQPSFYAIHTFVGLSVKQLHRPILHRFLMVSIVQSVNPRTGDQLLKKRRKSLKLIFFVFKLRLDMVR